MQDFRAELLKQDEPEAKEIALAIELFTHGSLNTFAKQTNVDTNNRLICYDILDLGKQLMPIGMLVVLDSILNRITQNRAKGKNTYIFIDEIYLLFQHEYSANFLFTLWKRVRKYPDIRLILVLPCRFQTRGWASEDVKIYENIKEQADKVVYTSEEYTRGY